MKTAICKILVSVSAHKPCHCNHSSLPSSRRGCLDAENKSNQFIDIPL